jgi:hypothetical protein
MRATFEAINQMQTDGVICHYALGGAVGATYYIEPITTADLEVFVTLPFDSRGTSASLASLHEHLKAHGCKMIDGEHFEVGTWPVQFRPTANELQRQAVAASLPVSFDDMTTWVWVMMPEHLMAIALAAHQLKDQPWMIRFIERDTIDELTLESILKPHGLTAEWKEFERKYPVRFASEEEAREQLAAMGFSEKTEILEKLRYRDRAIAAAGLRRTPKEDRNGDSKERGK